MAIEYVVDLECEAKAALGLDTLVSLVKATSRAETVLAVARAGGDRRKPSELTMVTVLTRDGKEDRRERNLQEVFDEAAVLAQHEHKCMGCPATVTHNPFGCYGSVRYPIAPGTERFLMSLLPRRIDSTAGKLLVSAIEKLGWDGAPAARLRARKGEFFEAEDAIVARWGNEFSITSDQVFQMLFGARVVTPSQSITLILLFGMIAHDVHPEEVSHLLQDRERLREQLASSPLRVPSDDGPIDEAARFLQTLCAAALLDVKVLVDA